MVVKIKTEDPFGNDITIRGHGGKRRISGSKKIANPEATSARLNNPVLRINRAFVTAVARWVKNSCVRSGSLIDGKMTPPSYLVQYLRDVTRNNQDALKSGKFDEDKLKDKIIKDLSLALPYFKPLVDDGAFDIAFKEHIARLRAKGAELTDEKIAEMKKEMKAKREEYFHKVFTLMQIMARELTPEQIITIKAVAGWEAGEESLEKVLSEYAKPVAKAPRARARPAPAAAVVERKEGRVVVHVGEQDDDVYLI